MMIKIDACTVKYIAGLLLLIFCLSVLAAEELVVEILSVNINIKDIFNDDEDIWLHELANDYHIKTKQPIILSLLSIKPGDRVTATQVLEAERLLREQPYLRDAKVTLSNDGVLDVTVLENWTLFPTVSFDRSGRKNSSSVGLRDSNLLGLGIETTLKYKKDPQKSGYRFRIDTPANLENHSYLSMILENYDAGAKRELLYEQPFYASDTEEMFLTSLSSSDIETTYFQNDDESGIAATSSDRFNLSYGWLDKQLLDRQDINTSYRTLVGLSAYKLDLNGYSSTDLANLFHIREKSFLWWGAEVYESNYQILQNIYITTNKEDINLGLQNNYRIGIGKIGYVDINNPLQNHSNIQVEKSNMLKFNFSATMGSQINNTLLLQALNFDTELYEKNDISDYFAVNYTLDIFYPVTEKITLFNSTYLSYVSEFRELPNSLGGENGLRGYPIQYQYGKQSWLSAFEIRYYLDYQLWDTFSFGWAGFIDVGRAWNNPSSANIENNTLVSAGIGLRIFPKISSGRNVIHIDLVRPYSNIPQINDWQWRILVKNSF